MMAYLLSFFRFILAAIAAVFAASTFQGNAPQTSQGQQVFYLRTNAPDEPSHNHNHIFLPTSKRLGLENFTVRLEPTSVKFLPIRLGNGNYALCGESVGNDVSKKPYLAALNSQAGTRTVSMIVVYVPKPTHDPFKANPCACPGGNECTADQWVLDSAGINGMYSDLRFAGFKGKWEPFKGTGVEGWHAYLKVNAGLFHSVHFDLVPHTA